MSRAKRDLACSGKTPISATTKGYACSSAGGVDSSRVRGRRQSIGIGLDITGGGPVRIVSLAMSRSAVRESQPGCGSSRQRRKRAVVESDRSDGDEPDGREQRTWRGGSGCRLQAEEGSEAAAWGVPEEDEADWGGQCEDEDSEEEEGDFGGEGFSEDGLGEEELLELQAEARERQLCSQGHCGGGDEGAAEETEEDVPEEWYEPEMMGVRREEAGQPVGAARFGFHLDDANGSLASLPCEVCGALVPALQLSAHQTACLGLDGWADGRQATADGCDPGPVPCTFRGVPQALACLDSHEALCRARARSRADDSGAGVCSAAGQPVCGGPQQPVTNPPGASSWEAGLFGSSRTRPPSVKAGALGSNSFSWSPPARQAQQQQARPHHLLQGLHWQRNHPPAMQDEIEDSSNGDEDADDFAPGGRWEPSWESKQHLHPEVPQPTRGQPSPAEAIFPHFRSLAALQRDGVRTAVDYLAQFTGKPTLVTGGAAGEGAASGGRRGKGKAAGRGPRRTGWRNVNGRNVYYDDKGKQNTGRVAYAKAAAASAISC